MAFALKIESACKSNPTIEASIDIARHRLLGLSLPLRLALTAQAAGASVIVTNDEAVRAALKIVPRGSATLSDQGERGQGMVSALQSSDERLMIPIVSAVPAGLVVFSAPANLVIHRNYMESIRDVYGERGVDLHGKSIQFEVPFGFDPILITENASFQRAQDALLRSLRKPYDGWASTYVNRPVSLAITRFLVALPLHPNQVSVAILSIGLVGAYWVSHGVYIWQVVGAVLFQMQSLLDGCDGEMARLTFRTSKTGEWLDTIGDDITNYSFFAAAAWGLYHHTQNILYGIAGLVIVSCGVLTSGIEYRYLISIGSGDLLKYPIGIGAASGDKEGAKRGLGRLVETLFPLFKRDTFVLLTLMATLVGGLSVTLLVFSLGAVAILITVLRVEVSLKKAAVKPY